MTTPGPHEPAPQPAYAPVRHGMPDGGALGVSDGEADASPQGDWIFTALYAGLFRGALDPSAFPAGSLALASGRAVLVGTVPLSDASYIQYGTADQSSVNALAVPAARTEYTAATGGTLNGAGLTIGILSDSFNVQNGMSSDIANGYLPAAAGQIHILKEGPAGSGDEGRAMAQLIYDIAPGATIDFYTAYDGESDFAAGITSLAAAGCSIIVDDVLYTDEPFYQDTGVITQAVESVISKGVDYFTAANNSANNFYESVFTPMSFALPGIGTELTSNVANGSPYEAVSLSSAYANVSLTVQWTQPFGSNAYDLGVGLYSLSNGVYTLVDNITNADTNDNPILTTDPELDIGGTLDNPSSGTYYLAFYDAIGTIPSNSTFKIIAYQGSAATIDGTNAGAGSGTSVGHELVPAADTVAAVRVSGTPSQGVSPPVVESFSAAGPGETYINAAGTILATPVTDGTPDLASTDGTMTSVFDPFYGTSAAAPNAAAVGLLMLQADPRLTTAQVTALLDRSAIPTASTITGGAGLIQANTAVASAISAAVNPIWTAQSTTTLWDTAGNWSDNAIPSTTGTVQLSDGLGIFTGAYAVAFNLASASVAALLVDGGTYVAARPTLTVGASDILTAGSVTLGSGTISLSGTLADSGALLQGSTAGSIVVGTRGALSIGGAAGAASIAFSGVGGRVTFTSASAATLVSGLTAAITGFAAGDTLDLAGLPASSVAAIDVSGSSVELVNASGSLLASLDLAGNFTSLGIATDSGGGTTLVACYLAGTRIATPRGERPIESLMIGDAVRTASGAIRPIRWIGRRRYPAGLAARDPELCPIRLPSGCLDTRTPRRDLYVSPRHAMLIDGMLVPAHRLLGWRGIARASLSGAISYFHIELDTHDALLAEGAASESFADTGNRHMFDNAADYAALYPNDRRPPNRFCAPRLGDHPEGRAAA
jgi:hypothetical protein